MALEYHVGIKNVDLPTIRGRASAYPEIQQQIEKALQNLSSSTPDMWQRLEGDLADYFKWRFSSGLNQDVLDMRIAFGYEPQDKVLVIWMIG